MRLFPPTVGIWFTNQSDEVRVRYLPIHPHAPRHPAPSCDPTPKITHPLREYSNLDKTKQVFKKLKENYEEEPYPSQTRMEELAVEFGAPDWTKIENFYKNMQLKHQETFQ